VTGYAHDRPEDTNKISNIHECYLFRTDPDVCHIGKRLIAFKGAIHTYLLMLHCNED